MRNSLVILSVIACMGVGAAAAQDSAWTGAYGGLSMATHAGSHDYDDGDDFYDLEGPAFGAFGGYNWANGNLVYGVEAALAFGGIYEVEPGGQTYKDEYEYDRYIDLKGRVGYAVGDVLVYGALGVSNARFRSDIGDSDSVTINTTGMLYGLGADYQFGNGLFAGGEFLRRDFDYYDGGQDVDIDAEVDSFTLRVGMRF